MSKSLVLVLVAALIAPICPADILVMKNGRKVETKGPWKVKGRQVIFTTPEGRLSSVRLREVDLEASDRLTHAPPPPPPPPPPPKFPRRKGPAPKPVMVLTNQNLGVSRSSSFMGQFTLIVNEIIRRATSEVEIDPEANPEAQAQFDRLMVEMDQVVSLIEDTCSQYPSLVETLGEEDLEQFKAELASCADDLEAKAADIKNPKVREVLTEAIPKLREAGDEVGAEKKAPQKPANNSGTDFSDEDEEEAFDDEEYFEDDEPEEDEEDEEIDP